jgi:hypothetical protein
MYSAHALSAVCLISQNKRSKNQDFRACPFGPVARRDKRPKPRCVFAIR